MSPLAVVSLAPADADRHLHRLFRPLTAGGRSWLEVKGEPEDCGALAAVVVRLIRARRDGLPQPPAWVALATGPTAEFARALADAEGLSAVRASMGTVVSGHDPAAAADLVEGALGGLGRVLLLRPRAESTVADLAAQLRAGDVVAACSAADVIAVTTERGTALLAGDGVTQDLVASLTPPEATGAAGSGALPRPGFPSRWQGRRTPAALLVLVALGVVVVAARVAGGVGTPVGSPSVQPSALPLLSQGATVPSVITLAPTSPHGGAAPSARQSPATAWDPVAARLVLFGGTGDAAPSIDLADTWTWDGTSWTARNPAQSPPARFGAVMAPAPGGAGVLLFGGMYRVGPAVVPVPLEDTWLWDGSSWSMVGSRGVPAPGERASALIVDPSSPRGDGLLLLTTAPGRTSAVAYTWDGGGWVAAHPATPGPVVRLAAPDSTHRQVLVLASDPPSGSSSTWAWRSGDWVRLSPPREVEVDALSAVLALDERSGNLLLVEAHFTGSGGVLTPATDRGGSWIWNGDAWSQQPGPIPAFISAFNATSPAAGYPGGALTLVGGDRGAGAYRQAARWDPATAAWQPA